MCSPSGVAIGKGARLGAGSGRLADRSGQLVGVAFRDQSIDRDLHEVGVGDGGGPGVEGSTHGLGHPVERPARSRAVGLEVVSFEDVEHLDDQDSPRGGRAHPVDVEAFVGSMDGRPDFGPIGFEIVHGDDAAVFLHVGNGPPGRLADVKLVGPSIGDPVEGVGEVALDQEVSLGPGGAVGLLERGDRGGEAPQPIVLRSQVFGDLGSSPGRELGVERGGERLGDGKALPGQLRRRSDQVDPGGLAPLRMGQAEAPDRPRDAGGHRAGAMAGPGQAIRAEIHGLGRECRGDLAEVDRHDLPRLGQVGHEEPATADVARRRVGDRERERRADRRVDRVPAPTEDVPPDVGRMPFLADDDMLPISIVRARREIRPGDEPNEAKQEPRRFHRRPFELVFRIVKMPGSPKMIMIDRGNRSRLRTPASPHA